MNKKLILSTVIFTLLLIPNFLSAQKPKIDRSDVLFKSGFFMDVNLGLNIVHEIGPRRIEVYDFYHPGVTIGGPTFTTKTIYVNTLEATLGIHHKIGNKWYFGSHPKYRLGFQAIWLQGGVMFASRQPHAFVSTGLGFASIFKINNKLGVEANCNIGPNWLMDGERYTGALVNLECKFRINYLAIGIDLAYGFGDTSFKSYGTKHAPSVSLSIGGKF